MPTSFSDLEMEAMRGFVRALADTIGHFKKVKVSDADLAVVLLWSKETKEITGRMLACELRGFLEKLGLNPIQLCDQEVMRIMERVRQ